ncbi:hypothetical protein RRG08_001949 [Elysia crispata]|uniref:Uncharacterized protein n=1 Tax=Elysia crispata TaxID=231223 RepID=A0AAE1BCA7_9GAST|nr:hypothetical protein RRG08_001949 [Elysia crispata]
MAITLNITFKKTQSFKYTICAYQDDWKQILISLKSGSDYLSSDQKLVPDTVSHKTPQPRFRMVYSRAVPFPPVIRRLCFILETRRPVTDSDLFKGHARSKVIRSWGSHAGISGFAAASEFEL